MSQHHFLDSITGTQITMGYDRPLDFVFCTVERVGGELLYSNLDDPMAGTRQQDIEYFRPILNTFSITVPESMFEEVKRDQQHRVGNRVMMHGH